MRKRQVRTQFYARSVDAGRSYLVLNWQREKSRIENFFCFDCDGSVLTTWKGVLATPAQRQMKEREYFTVESIKRHKIIGSNSAFLFSWEGYGTEDDSREPENCLDGCLDLLQKYWATKDIRISKQKALIGAVDQSTSDKSNWVDIETFVSSVNVLRSQYRASDINIEPFKGSGTVDQVYLLDHESHCHVVLYLASKHPGYISDGVNTFISDLSVRSAIREPLNIPLRASFFPLPSREDHCGS